MRDKVACHAVRGSVDPEPVVGHYPIVLSWSGRDPSSRKNRIGSGWHVDLSTPNWRPNAWRALPRPMSAHTPVGEELRGATGVTVVKATHLGYSHDDAEFGWLNAPWLGRVLGQ